MNKQTTIMYFVTHGISVLIIFLWVGYLFIWPPHIGGSNVLVASIADASVSQKENPYENIQLAAKAAFVWDIKNNNVLYNLNEETQLPLASLTKIMTVFLARGTLPNNTVITINGDALAQEGSVGFKEGERLPLDELINITLVASSNDGAYALGSAVAKVMANKEGAVAFKELMNQKAQEIGMHQTFFINESGLDAHAAVSGAYGSARDVATLFTHALQTYPNLFNATTQESYVGVSLDGLTHEVKNTNSIVAHIPSLVASKTGLTDLAGGNLAIVFEIAPLHPIVIIVLGSTEEGRFDDIKKLVDATISSFAH